MLTKINLSGNLLIVGNHYDYQGTMCSSLGNRGGIRGFSLSSVTRMRRYLRSCEARYTHMVTLTYPHNYGFDGKKCKEDLRRFIQELRRHVDLFDCGHKKLFSVFWFMEFQSRGSIHFHLFTTTGFRKEFISESWYRICGTEDERHLRAGTRIEKFKTGRGGMCSYAAKYAAKMEQKTVPKEVSNCGRFWGVSGLRGCVEAATTFEGTGDLKEYQKETRESIEALKVLVALYKKKGLLRQIRREFGLIMYVVRTEMAREQMYRHIMIVEYMMVAMEKEPTVWPMNFVDDINKGDDW